MLLITGGSRRRFLVLTPLDITSYDNKHSKKIPVLVYYNNQSINNKLSPKLT